MMAVKPARDRHRFLHGDERARGGRRLNLVLPVTAHPASHKGARYFDLELRTVPVDTKTWKADPSAMADAVDDHTVMIVGSAVSYAHGVVDPIGELGRLALEREVLFHVDGCIGGFVLPYFRRLGEEVTDFDFTVPGVTSMSMDFHKYGYCPKGASVVLYRDASIRRHQLFAASAWTGYTVINTTFQSTKSDGPLAATWAVLNYVGDDGFLEIFERTREARDAIIAGVDHLDELEVMGTPEASLVAVTATTADDTAGPVDAVNVFDVCDRMRDRRWFVQPQLGFAGSKANIHFSVGGSSLPLVPELLADLGDAVAEAKAAPTPPPDAGIVELLVSIDPDALDDDTFDLLLAGGGLDAGGGGRGPDVPSETAAINGLLQACPTPLAEKVLVEYFNRLYVP
jgi:glutamate/tyrosine decarboxylase-like PLP-dependent enzyme